MSVSRCALRRVPEIKTESHSERAGLRASGRCWSADVGRGRDLYGDGQMVEESGQRTRQLAHNQ